MCDGVHPFHVPYRYIYVPCIVLGGLNVRPLSVPLSVQPGCAGTHMCLGFYTLLDDYDIQCVGAREIM